MPKATKPPYNRITSGLRKNQFLISLVMFIEETLPLWRDDPERKVLPQKNEKNFNKSLCIKLEDEARKHDMLFCFLHESGTTKQRSVDIAAMPKDNVTIQARTFNRYQSILDIECKRLPAPSSKRKQEYLTGEPEITGGIQRFKLSLHGIDLNECVMIGYIEDKNPTQWFEILNQWISELHGKQTSDTLVWSNDEQLTEFKYDANQKTSHSQSKHSRIDAEGKKCQAISIHHLWVEMNGKS